MITDAERNELIQEIVGEVELVFDETPLGKLVEDASEEYIIMLAVAAHFIPGVKEHIANSKKENG